MKQIEIFKPGKHTAMSGEVIDFTAADLEATAKAYDPALWEAPLVVGHPKLNAPAYGWTKSLAFSGTLNAAPHQIDPAFAEIVNAGRFKKVSASFFAPTSPENPVPGVYYLRHIGFLGAQAPSVAGLKSASFAAGTDGVISFAVGGDALKRLFQGLRDMTIANHGIDAADRALPAYLIDAIDPPDSTNPSYAAATHQEIKTMPLTPEQIQALQDENARLKKLAEDAAQKNTEFAAREEKLSEQEARAKRAGITASVEALVKSGQLLPRDQAPMVEFMASLDAANVLEFADGTANRKVSGVDYLREFLSRMPKQVNYDQQTPPAAGTAPIAFAAPPGYSVDSGRAELHAKAVAHQAQHPNTSYDAALVAVSARQ